MFLSLAHTLKLSARASTCFAANP